MIEMREITDKRIWQEYLDGNYKGMDYPFFQIWDWQEVQKKLGFSVIRIGLFDNTRLVGVVGITDVNARRGHYLHLRHGPVLHDFDRYFDTVMSYVKKMAIEKGASFIRISPLLKKETIDLTFFDKRGFRYAPIHNMDAEICSILDITRPEEELLKNMRKSHRYIIKKASGYNIEIITSEKKADVQTFVDLYRSFSSKKKFVAHKGILEEMDVLGKAKEALLLFAKFDGKIISGVLVDYIGPMAVYHHAASDNAYKHIPSNYLLLWEAIKEAKRRKKTFFNFFGIAPLEVKKHPWNGFTLFKTGFGGERVEFVHAMDLPLNISYWKTYLIDWMTKKKKGY